VVFGISIDSPGRAIRVREKDRRQISFAFDMKRKVLTNTHPEKMYKTAEEEI